MNVLLDNCVPRPLGKGFVGHVVKHISELGWSAYSNGALLGAAAESGFGAVITVDQSMRYQQANLPLPLIVIVSPGHN